MTTLHLDPTTASATLPFHGDGWELDNGWQSVRGAYAKAGAILPAAVVDAPDGSRFEIHEQGADLLIIGWIAATGQLVRVPVDTSIPLDAPPEPRSGIGALRSWPRLYAALSEDHATVLLAESRRILDTLPIHRSGPAFPADLRAHDVITAASLQAASVARTAARLPSAQLTVHDVHAVDDIAILDLQDGFRWAVRAAATIDVVRSDAPADVVEQRLRWPGEDYGDSDRA